MSENGVWPSVCFTSFPQDSNVHTGLRLIALVDETYACIQEFYCYRLFEPRVLGRLVLWVEKRGRVVGGKKEAVGQLPQRP